MRTESIPFEAAMLIGIGATLSMDVWNALLRLIFNVRSLDYCLLGRWVRHMPASCRHASIAAAAPRRGECVAGWFTHYGIGVALALVFVLGRSADWLSSPTLAPALLFGLVTVVFPLFVLQPALGLGLASSKAARPTLARAKSLGTHLVFGIGLYVSAVARASVGAWVELLR